MKYCIVIIYRINSEIGATYRWYNCTLFGVYRSDYTMETFNRQRQDVGRVPDQPIAGHGLETLGKPFQPYQNV